MKRRIRLTEGDIRRIVKRAINERIYKGDSGHLYWEPAEDTKYAIGDEGENGWPNLLNKDDNSETGYQISGWQELPNDDEDPYDPYRWHKRRYSIWNNKEKNGTDFIKESSIKKRIRLNESAIRRIVKESINKVLNETEAFSTDSQAEASYFQIMRMRLSALSNGRNPQISARARQILDDIKQSDMSVQECLDTYWEETQQLKNAYQQEQGM